jgi:CheY-like chemotaxis protein/anti-sigma regulatory factor (Ser/Thr protein kinase)
VVGVYTNITDRKRAEQESDRAKRKEQEANLAKARFLAAASHDLRQPLHALGLFAAALAPLLRSSEQKELMTHMQSCLKSLGSLFSSLLDVSRLDAGVVQPVQTSFFLEEVINPLIEEFRPLACEKALDMRQVPCRAWVKGDRSLLGRVVRNLLSNAVKYTEKGKVLVGCRREGPHLRLEVWDTGPGIAAKDHRRIFEEFNRLPQASTQGVSGLGLGLSIAKRLTELAGWQMGLNSWPGRGSCFFLKLLRAQPENIRPVSAPAPAPVSLRGKRVICLDDDPDVLKSLVAILQRWRCRAYFYRSLADLEGSWQQAEPAPDLVIVDYHLEGDANGVEAIERIGILRGRPLPGLILTGDTTPKCLQAVQASGYPLLYKPVNPMRLRAALEACLS